MAVIWPAGVVKYYKQKHWINNIMEGNFTVSRTRTHGAASYSTVLNRYAVETHITWVHIFPRKIVMYINDSNLAFFLSLKIEKVSYKKSKF